MRWVRRYVLFHGKRHPRDLDTRELRDFLTHLASAGGVAASTQNQALAAIRFLYQEVLEIPLASPVDHLIARRPRRLPTVLSVEDVARHRGDRRRAAPDGGGALRQRPAIDGVLHAPGEGPRSGAS